MKTAIFTFVAANLLLTSAYGAEIQLCADKNRHWNGTRCATTATAAAVAAGSGIYAARKYKAAASIEEQNTQRVFTHSAATRSGEDIRMLNRATSGFTNGDGISVMYNLSEADNRVYHIELMESRAAQARSDAEYHARLSHSAMKTEYETITTGYDRNGNAITQTRSYEVPDTYARMRHASNMADELRKAAEYDAKAISARHGGQVPTYDLEKEIKVKNGTAEATSLFAQERIERGGKILSIDRLAVEHVNQVNSLLKKGTAGIAGVLVGVGIAAEEATVGMIANKIRETRNVPAMRGYQGVR